MREILFRGKSNSTNPKYAYYNDWIYGDLMTNYDKQFIHPKVNIFRIEHYLAKMVVSHEVDPETVGQFTGLTDKNGTKIFEDDIVELPTGEIGIIQWSEDEAKFEILYEESILTNFDEYWGKDLEVIGNIHDNPELLGSADEAIKTIAEYLKLRDK